MIKRYATIQLFPPTSKKYVSTFFNGHQQPQSASFLFGVQEPFGAKPGSPSPQAARPIDVLLPLREEKSSEESMGKFTHTYIYIYTCHLHIYMNGDVPNCFLIPRFGSKRYGKVSYKMMVHDMFHAVQKGNYLPLLQIHVFGCLSTKKSSITFHMAMSWT